MTPPRHTKHHTEELAEDGAPQLVGGALRCPRPPGAGPRGAGNFHVSHTWTLVPLFLKKSNWQNASRAFKVVTV